MDYRNYIIELCSKTRRYTNILQSKTHKDVLEYIHNWSHLLDDKFYALKTKIYWIINDIHEFPKCKTCGKELKNKNVFRLNESEVYKYCSAKCKSNNSEVREKYKKSLMEKFGVTNNFQRQDIKDKIKRTIQDKYGVDYYSQTKEWKQKSTESSLRHFGVSNPNQSEQIKSKKIKTCLEKYGTKYPLQSNEIKEKAKETCQNKYGCSYYTQTEESKERTRQIKLEKYGDSGYNNIEKIRETCLKRYGLTNGGGTEQSIKLARRRYWYDNRFFSSAPEIAYYIWLTDNNIKFEYQPKSKTMRYFDSKGKKHIYYPDFWLIEKNEIHEIKGIHHFQNFDKTQKMIWFKHPEKNYIAEAKYKCMKDNGVIILTNDEYKQYMDYCSKKFGKVTWYKLFKINRKTA